MKILDDFGGKPQVRTHIFFPQNMIYVHKFAYVYSKVIYVLHNVILEVQANLRLLCLH